MPLDKKEHPNFANRTGERHTTNQGYEIEIIDYKGSKQCTISFNDKNHTILSNIAYGNIKRGSVRNPYTPTFFNVGYTGKGKNTTGGRCGSIWIGLLERAYDPKHQANYIAYEGVTVCEEWHNFQNFAKWYEENYVEGWFIDKDILYKGNKEYSPHKCCFVPREINNLFTNRRNCRNNLPVGVSGDRSSFRATSTQNKKQVYFGNYKTPEEAFYAYKKGKEKYIKEVADKWKDKIDNKVYEAMYNWKIEITD